MPTTLHCPSCATPLRIVGSPRGKKCPSCGYVVTTPDRAVPPRPSTAEDANRSWTKSGVLIGGGILGIVLLAGIIVGISRKAKNEGNADPAATDPERVAYSHLAAEMSQEYWMPGRSHNGIPNRAVLEAAEKSPSTQLQKAARTMLAGVNKEGELLNEKIAGRERLRAKYQDMLDRANRGDFNTTFQIFETNEFESDGRPVRRFGANDTAWAIREAQRGLASLDHLTDEELRQEIKAEARK
ncbi:MAG TPA: hypothetical protein VGL71_02040, partial [Urbifossiella sp.]